MRNVIVFAGLALALGGLAVPHADQLTAALQSPKAATAVPVAEKTASAAAPRSVTVARDGRGHFQVDGRVDGRRVSFMVDTGASVVALTANDAARLGIRPAARDYTVQVKTANGITKAAPVTLSSLEVGGIRLRDVRALVSTDQALSENLLGLSFLSRLRRFEYSGGKLVLEQ